MAAAPAHRIPCDIHDASTLNNVAVALTSCVTDSLAAATKTSADRHSLWLPDELRARIRRTLCLGDIARANRLASDLRDELAKFKERQWWEKVSSLSTGDVSPFRITRARKLRKSRLTDHPLHGPSGLVYGDVEEVEVFADHIQRVFGDI